MVTFPQIPVPAICSIRLPGGTRFRFVVALFLAVSLQAAAPMPNIVVILADDMGWNQVGYHGSTFYETPNIDRLAREGVHFSDAYAAAPICSPTRAALMTGKAPARLHLTNYIPGGNDRGKDLAGPVMRQGLPLDEHTLAERLRERGYQSGLFGKWHLAPTYGYRPGRPMDPESQGFDAVFHSNKPSDADINAGRGDAHNTTAITDRAVAFIREQSRESKPFFCYVAHNAVHLPIGEAPELIEKYQRKAGAERPENNAVMAAMIETMDHGIGQILHALEGGGRAADTIVIFTSDNGNVVTEQSQLPFRGGKSTLWEGGIRVPLAIRWPRVARRDAVSAEPVITHDLFFTLCEAASITLEPSLTDGRSLVSLLRDGSALDRTELFWHYPHYHVLSEMRPASALRAGRYKLIEWHEGVILGRGPAASLFDLSTDPSESKDLAALEPELTARLRVKLAAWLRSVDAQGMTRR